MYAAQLTKIQNCLIIYSNFIKSYKSLNHIPYDDFSGRFPRGFSVCQFGKGESDSGTMVCVLGGGGHGETYRGCWRLWARNGEEEPSGAFAAEMNGQAASWARDRRSTAAAGKPEASGGGGPQLQLASGDEEELPPFASPRVCRVERRQVQQRATRLLARQQPCPSWWATLGSSYLAQGLE